MGEFSILVRFVFFLNGKVNFMDFNVFGILNFEEILNFGSLNLFMGNNCLMCCRFFVKVFVFRVFFNLISLYFLFGKRMNIENKCLLWLVEYGK